MEERRFDHLARVIASYPSRRRLLSGMLGTAVALAGLKAVGAQTCPPDQLYRRGVGCICSTTGRAPGSGGCPCQSGKERCGGTCVDPRTAYQADPVNCGACGHVCPDEMPVCIDESCMPCTTSTAIWGELTESDPIYWNCLNIASGAETYHFHAHPFVHCGGPLTIQMRGSRTGGGTLDDPLVLLYAGTFDPDDACANFIALSDDDICVLWDHSLLSLANLEAGPYTVIAQDHSDGQGTYTLEINMPRYLCPIG